MTEAGPITEIGDEPSTIEETVKEVLKKAIEQDGIARGIRECVKKLVRGEALVCILAQDCSEAAYTKLIQAICSKEKVHLIEIPSRSSLGEYVGLAKFDKEGTKGKVIGCSCVVIHTFEGTCPAWEALQKHFSDEA